MRVNIWRVDIDSDFNVTIEFTIPYQDATASECNRMINILSSNPAIELSVQPLGSVIAATERDPAPVPPSVSTEQRLDQLISQMEAIAEENVWQQNDVKDLLLYIRQKLDQDSPPLRGQQS